MCIRDRGDKSSSEDYLITRYIPELNWHLVVRQDTGKLMTELQQEMLRSAIIILLIIVFILIVITRVIRTFNRQIVALTQSMEQEKRSIFKKATEELFDDIYELDITRNRPANEATIQYFMSLGAQANTPYDEALKIVAEKQDVYKRQANDSLLRSTLSQELENLENPDYIDTLREYLNSYRVKYNYDSVFLVSTATHRYYNFEGLDRTLEPGNPENDWYYDSLSLSQDYWINVDNDEVAGADNKITVFINCNIYEDNGALLGTVGVGLQIDSLQALIQEYENQYHVEAYLVDQDGLIEIASHYTGYEKVNFFSLFNYPEDIRQSLL